MTAFTVQFERNSCKILNFVARFSRKTWKFCILWGFQINGGFSRDYFYDFAEIFDFFTPDFWFFRAQNLIVILIRSLRPSSCLHHSRPPYRIPQGKKQKCTNLSTIRNVSFSFSVTSRGWQNSTMIFSQYFGLRKNFLLSFRKRTEHEFLLFYFLSSDRKKIFFQWSISKHYIRVIGSKYVSINGYRPVVCLGYIVSYLFFIIVIFETVFHVVLEISSNTMV